MCVFFFFYWYGDHRDLHLLTHSFPTRRSSDLIAVGLGNRLGQRQAAEVQAALHPAGGRGRVDLAHINTHGTGAVARLFAGLQLPAVRSEEHTSELQSLMRISYAVFCLKKKTHILLYTLRHNVPDYKHTI